MPGPGAGCPHPAPNPMTANLFTRLAVAASAVAQSTCSVTMPAPGQPSLAAPQWQAPLPHQGDMAQLRGR